ncbi:MAG TPA: IS4 family transposase, partial [Wenzhouxiangella sp.]|nr:IS4 family transposase [Wenzhouxiangella sp.]
MGGYRLMRNAGVAPEAIAEAGIEATLDQIGDEATVLALEDTTTLSYRHQGAAELGVIGNDAKARSRGFLVHSVLLVDAGTEHTLGLGDQHYWTRTDQAHGKKHQRKRRAYTDKESYKWQHASQRLSERLGARMAHMISVCDRESDVYEYLDYKRRNGQRFVVRASVDRRLSCPHGRLFETLDAHATRLGDKTVEIPQRGGRKARRCTLGLSAMRVRLQPPSRRAGAAGEEIEVNAIVARELDAPAGVKPLCWRLLTSEPIDEPDQLERVLRYYELRWRIEDYHKVWKSGVGVERQRFQASANLERMLVITAFVAVRLLQLREAMLADPDEAVDCTGTLEEDQWKVLWVTTEKTALPERPPGARWAFFALARLGGFTDTKRTGRPGWATIWDGWFT